MNCLSRVGHNAGIELHPIDLGTAFGAAAGEVVVLPRRLLEGAVLRNDPAQIRRACTVSQHAANVASGAV